MLSKIWRKLRALWAPEPDWTAASPRRKSPPAYLYVNGRRVGFTEFTLVPSQGTLVYSRGIQMSAYSGVEYSLGVDAEGKLVVRVEADEATRADYNGRPVAGG